MTQKQNSNWIAIIAMFFLFAMISFVTNLAAPLGAMWNDTYDWSSMLGNMMNFLAYLFMGIPAGNLLVRIGYKRTAQLAMVVGVVGLLLQLSSGYFGADIKMFAVNGQDVTLNFVVYLLGAFICGFCVCMLNTVVNPMLNLLGGGGNRGNQLVQMGGAFNSLAGTLTPFLVGILLAGSVAKSTMGDVAPLLWIAIGVFCFALLVVSVVAIPEPHMRSGVKKKEKSKYSPWSFRHTTLGVVGIFFYVGLEVGIPGILIFYLKPLVGMGVAGGVAAVYWLLMLVGRLCSSVISKWVSSRTQLITVASTAIMLILFAIYLPGDVTTVMPGYADGSFSMVTVPVSALLLVLCGLCTSVMWGGIFNLAVEGLGRYTAQASGIFMMMVVGGGVMPLIQDWIADMVGYMNSYWLVIAMLFYLLYYALLGSKNVNRDIPVDDMPDPRNL